MEYVLTATKTEARAGSYYDKIWRLYDLTFKLNGYGRSLDQYFAAHPPPVSRGARILDAGCGHAAHHPTIEGVTGDDQAELELGQFATLLRHEVRGGDEQLGRRRSSPRRAPGLRFRQRLGRARSGLIDHERRRR